MRKFLEALIIAVNLFRTRRLLFIQKPRRDPTSDVPIHVSQLDVSIPVGSIIGPIYPFNEKAPTGPNSLSKALGITFVPRIDDT